MASLFLIRFAQTHETFRRPELEALAELHDIQLNWKHYERDSPYAIISLEPGTPEAARRLISRSVLAYSIYEFWAQGKAYADLHENVKRGTQSKWPQYRDCSFRFDVDTFGASRPTAGRYQIIESFSYLPFGGPIIMKEPKEIFTVFEQYEVHSSEPPRIIFFGRWIADGGRKLVTRYDLKKRKYIATTSMDAELSLLTANIAKAAPGKLAYDPFMGTGSFPVSCAAFEGATFGSDLDGRSLRGKTPAVNVAANFKQYGTSSLYLGGCVADLTNTPIANRQILDTIICDPPYGVREGLKVLGHVKERLQAEVILNDGTPAHLQDDYIPPKRPYSFVRMLDDILDFSAARLVTGGRLCMWMPVANAAEAHDHAYHESGAPMGAISTPESKIFNHTVPKHPCLKIMSICQQDFTKWSRHLLTYDRLHDSEVDSTALTQYKLSRQAIAAAGLEAMTADNLNEFRKKYFEGFKE